MDVQFNPFGFLFFIVFAALPAWYMNKFLLKYLRPRESFGRLLLYILSSFVIALVYTTLACYLLLEFIWKR